MKIAEYFATGSILLDKNSVTKFNTQLNSMEARLVKFNKLMQKPLTLNISTFKVDDNKLRFALGNALDAASPKVAFEISRFVVNDRNMLAALLRAARRLPPTPPGPNPPHPPGGGPHPPYPPYPPYPPRPGPGSSAASYAAGGLMARGLSSLYGPALALAFGGYGLAQVNKKNQQIVSAELGNAAVVGPENGKSSFEWLKRQGNELGFNWLEQAPEFTGFLGSATPLMGYDKSLETYKAFNEFATTRHADPVARKRALKAIQQMAAKGQVNTEELQNQLGDAANFGELPAVFAKAYQEFTKGNKTGAEAAQALKEAMKKGKVKTGDVLPIVTRLLAEMAAPTLDKSKTSSQSEQGRYQNTVNEMYTVASQAGVEEGFARIFRTLNGGLKESGDLVRFLSEGFNDVTKWADDLLLWPQSFMRALDGRDSLVADWLGKDATEQLRKDWADIKASIQTIKETSEPTWIPRLENVTKDIANQIRIIAQLSNGDFSGLSKSVLNAAGGKYRDYGDMLLNGPNFALRTVGNIFDTSVPQLSIKGMDVYVPKSIVEAYGLGKNLSDSTSNLDMLGSYNKNQDSNAFGVPFTDSDLSLKYKSNTAFDNVLKEDSLNVRPNSDLDGIPEQLSPATYNYPLPYDDQRSADAWKKDVRQALTDDAKASVMEGAKTINSNNTNNNQITVNLSVVNPEGVSATDERQVEILAKAVASQIVQSLESTQAQTAVEKE